MATQGNASGSADVGSSTAKVGSDTAQVGSGTASLPPSPPPEPPPAPPGSEVDDALNRTDNASNTGGVWGRYK